MATPIWASDTPSLQPFKGAAPLAVGPVSSDSRAIILTTASTALVCTLYDGSSVTLTGLSVGVVYPFAVRSITSLGGGTGLALL